MLGYGSIAPLSMGREECSLSTVAYLPFPENGNATKTSICCITYECSATKTSICRITHECSAIKTSICCITYECSATKTSICRITHECSATKTSICRITHECSATKTSFCRITGLCNAIKTPVPGPSLARCIGSQIIGLSQSNRKAGSPFHQSSQALAEVEITLRYKVAYSFAIRSAEKNF